jgi:UDP-N-acetylmuramate--alanine ligase
VDEEVIRESLAEYRGVGRRMEIKGEVGGVTVIDDYGHHPTAIAKTLEAVRERYPVRRVWAVYEPLTYHRTAQMLDRFADVLASADEVAIADIWAGRDPDTTVTSAAALAAAVRAAGGPEAAAPGSVEATADHLATLVQPGDVVLVMGGGRSYVIAERLVELLGARASAD